MSPFKKCIMPSQQILYKSLYLNPLSDQSENPLSYSSASTSSSSLLSTSSSASSSTSLKDQSGSSSLKENDPPQLGRTSTSEAAIRCMKEKPKHNLVSKREPLRARSVGLETEGIVLQLKGSTFTIEGETEETAPLFPPPTPTHFSQMWEDPECEVSPASSWSTLGNRMLVCRPLPLDVGRCICYIKKERHNGQYGYILYTDEGQGRQDRKLAVAVHRRRSGRSEFEVYSAGVDASVKSEGMLGKVRANLVGSRYSIWDELDLDTSPCSQSPTLVGVVMFKPTVSSLTGTFRVMRVSIPKYQSTQIVPFTHHGKVGFPPDWEEHPTDMHRLCSRKPLYNKVTRRYELDFRDRAKRTSNIKTSAKNLLLTMIENGKQAILLFVKVGKSKYLLEYRFPLTGYQAFSICLSSIDSKLCCTI